MPINTEIKQKIISEIESLPETEQETILGLVENYIQNKTDETDWDKLPESLKKRIEESMRQGDEGKHILNDDAVNYIRKKHGLND